MGLAIVMKLIIKKYSFHIWEPLKFLLRTLLLKLKHPPPLFLTMSPKNMLPFNFLFLTDE